MEIEKDELIEQVVEPTSENSSLSRNVQNSLTVHFEDSTDLSSAYSKA